MTASAIPRFPGPVLIVSNPQAKNGEEVGAGLYRELRSMAETNAVGIDGPLDRALVKIDTKEDQRARIDHIVHRAHALHKEFPHKPITAFSVGGDRTAADLLKAARRIADLYADIEIHNWVWPAGRANDLSTIASTPSRFKDIPAFLRSAIRLPFWGAELFINDAPIPHELYHGATFGVTGIYFQEMADKQQTIDEINRTLPEGGKLRKLEVGDYVKALPRAMMRGAGAGFFISIDGGEPIPTGEIFMPVAHQFGRVGIMPLPPDGSAIFLAPHFARLGLVPIFEVMFRGLMVTCGFEHAIHPNGSLYTLCSTRGYKRHFSLPPKCEHTLEVLDQQGNPVGITGIINGDPTPEKAHKLRLVTMEKPVTLIGAPHSQLTVRQGLNRPHLPFDRMMGGWVSKIAAAPVDAARMASFVGSGMHFAYRMMKFHATK